MAWTGPYYLKCLEMTIVLIWRYINKLNWIEIEKKYSICNPLTIYIHMLISFCWRIYHQSKQKWSCSMLLIETVAANPSSCSWGARVSVWLRKVQCQGGWWEEEKTDPSADGDDRLNRKKQKIKEQNKTWLRLRLRQWRDRRQELNKINHEVWWGGSDKDDGKPES